MSTKCFFSEKTAADNSNQNKPGQVNGQVDSADEKWLLIALKACIEQRKSSENQKIVGIKHRETFQRKYLDSFLAAGLLEHTVPDKPQNRLQNTA